MVEVRRRTLIAGTPALGLAACRTKATRIVGPEAVTSPPPHRPHTPPQRGRTPFLHGVASGDPLPDRVIVWTRVTPPDPSTEIETHWVLARDPSLRRIVAEGTVRATAARDHTVKVDVTGLEPGRQYHYQFEARGHRSPVGRTRTPPVGATARVRLAVASCSNYPFGYFNAYAAIARRDDLQAVLHLGDYLYEYANGTYGDGTALDRLPDPADREMVTLADYRDRHAVYKTDPDLQALHQRHPIIATWDDHEITNDTWTGGAQNHQPDEGDWMVRRAAAIQAYYEWMPVRALPTGAWGQLYRSFRFGDLLDLVMLDTRVTGRDRQADWHTEDWKAITADPRRSLLGAPQEAWLARQLERSRDDGIPWRLLGQQVLMGQMLPRSLGDWINTDMWDGYAPARARLLDHLAAQRIEGVVALTGDIHSSWGLELASDPFGKRYQPGKGAVAVEFVCPAVSSPPPVPPAEALDRERHMLATHPHLRWIEVRHRGYVLLDVDHERTQAEWHLVDSVDERSPATRFARGLATPRGPARLVEVDEPSSPITDVP
ncbi:MAG: alkaline phosphatase D family protein [Deltaproteobacteria bacterium]|nr:alkaline phosphatase D family protein [Deltaproteobacteria bacterium]